MLSSLLKTSSPYRYLKSFHTSPISFRFVKDVYKEIQYEAPYRPGDKQKVLQVINSAPLKELGHFTSKKVSQTIVNFRKEGGYFDCVEQLLDLDKIEKRHIEKLCESILSEPNPETIRNSVANDRTKIMKKKKELFRNIIPKLDPVPDLVDTSLVGLHLSLQGITYSKKYNNELMDWGIIQLPCLEVSVGRRDQKSTKVVEPTTQTYFEHHNLFTVSEKILERLPNADYYILEEPLPMLPKDPYMKPKLNLLKLRTALLTLLQLQNSTVHSMKPNVPDVLFNLKQGNERISVQEVIQIGREDERISVRVMDDEIEEIHIEEKHKQIFENIEMRYEKEHLMLSLLKTVAFSHLCEADIHNANANNNKKSKSKM